MPFNKETETESRTDLKKKWKTSKKDWVFEKLYSVPYVGLLASKVSLLLVTHLIANWRTILKKLQLSRVSVSRNSSEGFLWSTFFVCHKAGHLGYQVVASSHYFTLVGINALNGTWT